VVVVLEAAAATHRDEPRIPDLGEDHRSMVGRSSSSGKGPRATLPTSSKDTGGHRVAKPYVRLTQPLVRNTKGGELRPASWEEALAKTVAGFQAAKAAHGPTTFGTFSCSKATNEVNFAAQKFSRTVLGSNNIDSCNRT
jgi:NADH dehydrogenase/NADH:ubiquinone oxidoreductase subunit G